MTAPLHFPRARRGEPRRETAALRIRAGRGQAHGCSNSLRASQTLPASFQILLGSLLSPAGVPLRAGVGGTGDRDFLPANPVPPICRYPFTPAATWEIDNLGRPLDGWSAFTRLYPCQEPARGLFEAFRFQVLSCSPRAHGEQRSEGSLSWVTNLMSRITKCL